MAPRRARRPLVVVALVGLLGVVVLECLWLAAHARIGDPPTARTTDTTAPPAASATPLLSLRRAPTALSRHANEQQLRTALGPLLASVSDRSCVSVAVDGQVVAAKNPTLPVIPASNEKLLVAAAALQVLGPSHVFTTSVVGAMGADGRVAGDLGLVGGGDPLLATSWYPDSGQLPQAKYPQHPATSLESLADAVVAAGVRSIGGSVVGDERHFDGERYAPFWDASLRKQEVGPLSALMVNDDVAVSGANPVDDPPLAAAQVFARLLTARGVTITGASRAGAAPAGAQQLAKVDSAPLAQIVGEMLTNSDNNTAELVVKELGAVRGGAGTRAAGLAVVDQALRSMDLPMDGVTLQDGSGLGRGNALTCQLLVALLSRYQPDDPLLAGMATAGVSGTLRPEFTTSAVQGRLRAKTGSLTGVKALSGYLPADGTVIEFSVLINDAAADQPGYYQPIWQNRLAAVIAGYPAGPAPDELAPR
jgi:D-alanyl-D-alanine carboxypeptidase/D-alanyl-D-alanine-endopeptidase (penicillin-binding protein 4)